MTIRSKIASTSRRVLIGALVPVLLLGAGALHAAHHDGDGRAHGGIHPADRLDRLTAALELTEEQRYAVEGILCEARETGRALMREARESGDREAAHEAIRARREAVRESLAAVLTPAQMTELDALRKNRRAAGRAHREDRREARFEALAERLELHESQEVAVAEVMSEARERGREILREAHAEGADRDDVRARMTSLRAESREALAGILTPAQLEELAALEAEREAEREARHAERGHRSGHGRGHGRDHRDDRRRARGDGGEG